MADKNHNIPKKLPVVILAVALAIALILALVANNGKNAAINANEQLAAAVEEMNTTLTDLQAQAETAKADLEAKTAELTTAQADLEAKAAELTTAQADLEAKAAELEAAKADAETAKADADAKLADTEAAAATAAAAAEANAAELTAAVAAAEEAKAAAEAKAAELEAAVAAAEEAKAAAEAQIAEIDAAKAETEAKAAALEAELAAAIVTAATPVASDALAGKLVILHTNDIHGRAVADEESFGYARIAQMKKNLEAQGAEVLLMDAGDYSQGTPIVNLGYGKNAIAFMNAAGYDLATLGNHEFDWGFDNMMQIVGTAEFPVVCANLTRSADGTLVLPANVIFETVIGKVGVFGLDTPETMTKTHPDKVKGITFSMLDELYADAAEQVAELEEADCDLIVCLAHLGDADESNGNRSVDLLANVSGIDVLIDGHSHTTIDGGVLEGETLRTSTGEYSGAIGYIVFEEVTEDDVTSLVGSAGLYTMEENAEAEFALSKALAEDPAVAELVNTINAQVEEELSATFAVTEVMLDGNRAPGVRTQETNLGDFSADAILWAAKQALGEDAVDCALTNGGGIRASIEVGEITMKTMKTVFPFGNEVATLTVTGAELLEALEAATWSIPEAIGAFPQVAGIEFTLDTTVPYVNGDMYPDSTYYAPANPGARVTIATVGGEPWAADAEYVLATNDFTAAGGDTYYVLKYPFQQTGYKTGVALEDALVNYTQTVLDGLIGEQYAAPAGRIIIK